MDTITEVFLEGWDDAEQARQKRDVRVAELQQQGFDCSLALFYNILTGKRIYLVEATLKAEDSPEVSRTPRSYRPKPRPTLYQSR